MNKTLIALAVLAGFAGAAAAQSSVTLSGSIDAGVRRANSDTAMAGAASSRNNITFSGVEDLGNGNSAFFTLNHRFSINGTQNGANNTTLANASGDTAAQFYRNAFVGLKNNNIGDVRLGRVLFPLQEINGGFEPWNGGDTVAAVHTDGRVQSAVTSTLRANSTIYVRSANFGGFVGHAAVGAADGGGTQTNSVKPQGFGGVFTFGPATVAAAYDRNGKDIDTVGLYAKYNAGFATFYGQYEKNSDLNGAAAGTPTDKRVSLSAAVPYGAFTGKVGYLNMNNSSLTGSAKKVGVGLDYALSKRTTIYSDAAKVGGSAAEVATVAGGVAANDAASRKYRFDIGVQHKF